MLGFSFFNTTSGKDPNEGSSSRFSSFWSTTDTNSSTKTEFSSDSNSQRSSLAGLLSSSFRSEKGEKEEGNDKAPPRRLHSSGSDNNSFRFSGFYKRMTPSFRKTKLEQLPAPDPVPLIAPIGSYVSTLYGTGKLIEFRASDGMHLVRLAWDGHGYMCPSAIHHEIKAMVGDRVSTQWGHGTISAYLPQPDLYVIELDWRWDDDHVWKMKATVDKFERLKKDTPMSSVFGRTSAYLSSGYVQLMDSTYAHIKSKFPTPIRFKRYAGVTLQRKKNLMYG